LFAGIDRYFLQLIARFRFLSLLLGYAIIVAAGLALDGLLMEDPSLFLYFFLLIGLVEIAAYFSNISYGKHLLFPRLNSKKTWEGFACSAIVTITFAAAWGALYWHFSANILMSFILLSLVVFAVSVAGTLFKNLLERAGASQSLNSGPPKYAWLSIDYPLAILAAAPVFCFGISLILVHVRPWLNFL
jgi:phosphatidate cytidylyltransferase